VDGDGWAQLRELGPRAQEMELHFIYLLRPMLSYFKVQLDPKTWVLSPSPLSPPLCKTRENTTMTSEVFVEATDRDQVTIKHRDTLAAILQAEAPAPIAEEEKKRRKRVQSRGGVGVGKSRWVWRERKGKEVATRGIVVLS
jgi:hypothetical protein